MYRYRMLMPLFYVRRFDRFPDHFYKDHRNWFTKVRDVRRPSVGSVYSCIYSPRFFPFDRCTEIRFDPRLFNVSIMLWSIGRIGKVMLGENNFISNSPFIALKLRVVERHFFFLACPDNWTFSLTFG